MSSQYRNEYQSLFIFVVIILPILISACASIQTPTTTPTLVPTSTTVPSATPEPTATSMATETPSPTLEPTDTEEPSPTAAVDASVVSACPVSADSTYGYTDANAIKVGGDFFTGVAREKAYLDTLRGPEGQRISYERAGSTSFGDTILDIYILNYSGLIEEITLYIDLYTFEELFAPIGFICDQPFPLKAP